MNSDTLQLIGVIGAAFLAATPGILALRGQRNRDRVQRVKAISDIDKIKSEIEAKLWERVQGELDDTLKQITKLQSALDDATAQIVRLNDRVRVLEAENERLRRENDKLRDADD